MLASAVSLVHSFVHLDRSLCPIPYVQLVPASFCPRGMSRHAPSLDPRPRSHTVRPLTLSSLRPFSPIPLPPILQSPRCDEFHESLDPLTIYSDLIKWETIFVAFYFLFCYSFVSENYKIMCYFQFQIFELPFNLRSVTIVITLDLC